MSQISSNLAKLQLQKQTLTQLEKNKVIKDKLENLVDSLSSSNFTEQQSILLYDLVALTKEFQTIEYPFIGNYIVQDKIRLKSQLLEAIEFYKSNSTVPLIDQRQSFEDAVGVDVKYTKEQYEKYTTQFIDEHKAKFEKNPYDKSLMKQFKEGLKFCEEGILVGIFNEQIKPFVEAKKNQVQQPKDQQVADKPKEDEDHFNAQEAEELLKTYDIKKLVARQMQEALNPKDINDAHIKRTGGKIVTRFPPEPNGYLHIGHCKAIRFNFKLAADYGGYTNLRYDDTNPTKENQEYIDKILENVKWMGYEPSNIFFASDYFGKFYEHAITLIKMGKAFVCKQSKAESKDFRENKKPSPYRDTSVEANLYEFELMRAGYYEEQEAVLRAKIDYAHPNPNNRDPAIFRIMYVDHPHVGDRWCIYPLYDFVHCISDSIEDITHSCCTLEFENRRDLYYWFLEQLNIYRPHVYEYGRLNLSYNVLSKRKLIQLIEANAVNGWDDPRLLTIAGLQRRGVPPESINYFCDLISVSRRGNDTQLDIGVLEYCIRNYLQEKAPHALVVMDPVEVRINGLQEQIISQKENKIPYDFKLTSKIFVEKADVREKEESGFYGCAPGKIVRLRYGPFLKVLKVDSTGVEAEVIQEDQIENQKKVKGILHWVSAEQSLEVEVRQYARLFKDPFPGKRTGNVVDDLNPKSLEIFSKSRMPIEMLEQLKDIQRWQFERKGFFSVDIDTKVEEKKVVFNQIIDLKQSKLKGY